MKPERFSVLRDIAERAREDQGDWPEEWAVGPDDVNELLDELRRFAADVVTVTGGVYFRGYTREWAQKILDAIGQAHGEGGE